MFTLLKLTHGRNLHVVEWIITYVHFSESSSFLVNSIKMTVAGGTKE